MRLHKLRMITKDGGSNVFATSSKLKRIFSLVSFVINFALVCYVLFHISHFPKNLDDVKQYSWLALMVIACWWASRVANLNLHLSYSTTYSSFFFALVLNAYMIVFVMLNINVKPEYWDELMDQYLWWIPIMAIGSLWKLKFAIFEYKARPYFAIKKLLNFIISILLIGIMIFGIRMINKYLIDKEHFDYLEPMTFFGLMLMMFGVVFILVFGAAEFFYFNKYGKSEVRTKKTLKLWMGLLQVGSVAVWLIIKTVTANNTGGFHITWTYQEWIYAAVALITVSTIIFVAATKKEAGGGSRVFLLTSTTGIIVLIITAYMFQVWWKANMFANAIILFPSITIILIINAVIEPKMPHFYATVYLSLMSSLALYALLLWITEDAATLGNSLPFHLDEIIFVPTIITSVSIEMIAVSSYWWTITRISKYSSKSMKTAIKPTKGENHE